MDRPSRSRALLALVTAGFVLGCLELGSWVTIALLERVTHLRFQPIRERLQAQTEALREILDSRGTTLLELDAEIGWTYAPDRRIGKYSSNAQGLRGTRDYAPEPPEGVLRIATFGDSFVHGNEVGDDDAWAARLERIAPGVELLNHGVGGYGTDQALLLFRRRGSELHPHLVLLGIVEVDYARNVNRYRRFLSTDELPLFKPRFVVAENGSLDLVPQPFPTPADLERLLADPRAALKAAPGDWFFEVLEWRNPLYDRSALVRLASTLAAGTWRSRLSPERLYRDGVMNTDSPAFAILVALVRTFAREVEESGQRFAVLIFPTREEDIWGEGPRAYAPLLDALHGILVLDLAETLRLDDRVTAANLRRSGGHYSELANDAVALGVRDRLVEWGLLRGAEETAPPAAGFGAASRATTPAARLSGVGR